jgi:hypothetical protein
MYPINKKISISTFAVIASSLLIGCVSIEKSTDSDAELTPVVMQLDWIFNSQFAGLFD